MSLPFLFMLRSSKRSTANESLSPSFFVIIMHPEQNTAGDNPIVADPTSMRT